MINFGSKLKELRLAKGKSQKDLAEYLNISFQSVSKWESGIHYPDVFLLEKIANYFDVGVEYFFDSAKTQKKEKVFEEIETTINVNSTIVTWTDFIYNNTIAPVAELDKTRHCAGNRYLKTHPGPKDYLIIAVDKNNKICFFGLHYNNHIPTCGPDWCFYSKSGEEGKNNPCLIIEDSYFKSDARKKNYFGFEFVIPQGGFLINIPIMSIEHRNILSFLLPKDVLKFALKEFPYLKNDYNGKNLFRGILLPNELNHCNVYLKDNKIIFEKDFVETDKPSTEKKDEKIEELEQRIEALEERIEKYQMMIDELESMVSDCESRIYDLEDRIDED